MSEKTKTCADKPCPMYLEHSERKAFVPLLYPYTENVNLSSVLCDQVSYVFLRDTASSENQKAHIIL